MHSKGGTMILDKIKWRILPKWEMFKTLVKIDYIRDILQIRTNAILGKQFIPDPRVFLKIETSGVCNLACVICAYSKKTTGLTVMPLDLFQNIVKQAEKLGYTIIGLTPLTGEVFMDKGVFEKMRWLDGEPSIREYTFYTNLVVPSVDQIKDLFKLKKLSDVHISLYGHDKDSFKAITQRSESQYYKLVRNLEVLFEHAYRRQFRLELSFRTVPNFHGQEPPSELERVVSEFEKIYNVGCSNITEYNNWGGLISDEDVRDIGLKLNDVSQVYKYGACALIFNSICVLADGRVNACACRDVHGSLVIGNVNDSPLEEIISAQNPRYVQLIERQMRNEFAPICSSCDFYRSIYKKRAMYTEYEASIYKLRDIKDILGIMD